MTLAILDTFRHFSLVFFFASLSVRGFSGWDNAFVSWWKKSIAVEKLAVED
jgi:hypothetical protein